MRGGSQPRSRPPQVCRIATSSLAASRTSTATRPIRNASLACATTASSTFASYTYDQAGNQTSRTYPAINPSNTDSWDYIYDGKDQLRRATKKHGGVVTGSEEYWYDGGGKRMAIVKRDAAGTKTELVWFLG